MKTTSKVRNHAAEAQGIGKNPRRRYAVTVERAEYSECTLNVDATSRGEAEESALRLAKWQNQGTWIFGDCSFIALKVRQLKGVPSHV